MIFSLINLAGRNSGWCFQPSFAVGGIWYSRPKFLERRGWWIANSWQEELKKGNKGKIFGFTAIFSLIMAANLAMFLTDAMWDAKVGTSPQPGALRRVSLLAFGLFAQLQRPRCLNKKAGVTFSSTADTVLFL